MSHYRQWVEVILYGSGNVRRFTQDNPVLPDLWAEYLNEPGLPQHLLIEPWLNQTSLDVARELTERLKKARMSDARVASNRTLVVATLTLHQLISQLVPITGWYFDLKRWAPANAKTQYNALPEPEQLWDDVVPPRGREAYEHRKALSFVRMAGFIAAWEAATTRQRDALRKLIEGLLRTTDGESARRALATKMLRAFKSKFAQDEMLPEAAGRPFVFKINKNRPATLAIVDSVRTVKADAANSLFSVNCSRINWAVIDSGIDATHPAFRDRDKKGESDLLKASRVRQTFDFTYFREILLGEPSGADMPERLKRVLARRSGQTGAADEGLETVERIRKGLPVDWEDLRPLITVPHTKDAYEAELPVIGHGTHVAGILGADWHDEDDDSVIMKGVCPDIRLIDIRVCRPDGTSDEFVIISALQFLRYLNANSDVPAVHGANMSLSLVADVASYACGQTPVCVEAERNTASGIVTVVAAGNLGFRRFLGENNALLEQYFGASITDPGNAEGVITVGSTHRREPHSYGVSYFSSRGPTGDGRIKPDIVAPGEKINAPTLGGSSMVLDGTSMAAPHVSGAAAMLLARHPELVARPQRIKSILCKTATDLGRERYFQGHGLLDTLRALQSV